MHINRDYINNIKQYTSALQEEIMRKESRIIPKTSGKKLISQQQQDSLAIIGMLQSKADLTPRKLSPMLSRSHNSPNNANNLSSSQRII